MVLADPLSQHPLNDRSADMNSDSMMTHSLIQSDESYEPHPRITSTNTKNSRYDEPLLFQEITSNSPASSASSVQQASTGYYSNHNNNSITYSRSKINTIQTTIMKNFGNFIVFFTFLTLIISTPILLYHYIHDENMELDLALFLFAGAFTAMSVLISSYEIFMHLTHWYMPDVQKYVVRILYMVPIFAIQSWLSLRFYSAVLYIDTLRDLYEAFVISSFVYFIVELLGGEDSLADKLRDKSASYGEHVFPFNFCFRRWEMGEEFMLECKWGTLQYVVVKTLLTVLTLILEPLGLYGEGSWSWKEAYIYITIILNVSVSWALYCLVLLFHATQHDLRHPKNWHPLGKFICVKGVVFFTWWQSIGIQILQSMGIITGYGEWDSTHVAAAVQDTLICVEMFLFAIAHMFSFTYKEYMSPDDSESRMRSLLRSSEYVCPELEDEDEEGYAAPPTIRTLDAPASFSHAFWSSTVPNETLSDIKRLGAGTSRIVKNSRNLGTPMINMSKKYAESI